MYIYKLRFFCQIYLLFTVVPYLYPVSTISFDLGKPLTRKNMHNRDRAKRHSQEQAGRVHLGQTTIHTPVVTITYSIGSGSRRRDGESPHSDRPPSSQLSPFSPSRRSTYQPDSTRHTASDGRNTGSYDQSSYYAVPAADQLRVFRRSATYHVDGGLTSHTNSHRSPSSRPLSQQRTPP
jgi:hypothetical protein